MEGSISEFVERSYDCACRHGFHDKELSVPHMLMLILTEVSEVVDADRKGIRASLGWYNERSLTDRDFYSLYSEIVKPSVEAELADVVIRICDTCGALDILPHIVSGAEEDFRNIFGNSSLCEKCFYLCQILCRIDETLLEGVGEDSDSVEWGLGSALTFVLCMCEDMGIDIEKHVELKMRYNDMRPYRNGKSY